MPPIFTGFFGLLLVAFAFVSLGIAISACTSSQTVAGVVGLVALLVFYVVDAPVAKLDNTFADVLTYIAPNSHVELFLRGAIEGRDVVYFLSVIAFGLFAF